MVVKIFSGFSASVSKVGLLCPLRFLLSSVLLRSSCGLRKLEMSSGYQYCHNGSGRTVHITVSLAVLDCRVPRAGCLDAAARLGAYFTLSE